MALTNGLGNGLLVYGAVPYAMSALPFTAFELDNMKHAPETYPRDKVILTVDYAQNGLGNRSCGPDVLPQYRLHPEKARFVYTITGFSDHKANFRVGYPESMIGTVHERSVPNADGFPAEVYRDPSDEDIRKASGFDV